MPGPICSGGGSSGNVVGPASATDNAFALFDGVTGKLIKELGSLPTRFASDSTGTPAAGTFTALNAGNNGGNGLRITTEPRLKFGNGGGGSFVVDFFGDVDATVIRLTLDNTDYTNTAGAGSHLVLNNPNASGQNVICSIINGNIVSKWRSDVNGSVSWVAGASGNHDFYTGGDYGIGTMRMRIANNGDVSMTNALSVTGATTLTGGVIIGTPAARPGGTIFTDFTTTSTTHTDGTEDDLYSHTAVASTLGTNGDSIEQVEHISFVSSATAARRVKKYFAGTLIFDSGALTLTLGGEFSIFTSIIRESSSVVRCDVSVTSTSASTLPYSTYTRITGLTLSSTNVLKTTGIASGTGATSADISNNLSRVSWNPA